jgi:hypothetical protein
MASIPQPFAAMYLTYGNENEYNSLPMSTIGCLGMGGPILALIQYKVLLKYHPQGATALQLKYPLNGTR